MEGAPQLDNAWMTRRLESETLNDDLPSPMISYKERIKYTAEQRLKNAKNKQIILKAVMNLHPDGNLDLPSVQKPNVATMKKLLHQAYDTGDEHHFKTAADLAKTYKNYPFVNVNLAETIEIVHILNAQNSMMPLNRNARLLVHHIGLTVVQAFQLLALPNAIDNIINRSDFV